MVDKHCAKNSSASMFVPSNHALLTAMPKVIIAKTISINPEFAAA